MSRAVIAIHGGAGTINRARMTPEKEHAYIQALNAIVAAGQNILAQGGSALDAVTKAVTMLEDNPLFNAGKGAVFTHAETHELDAAIMDGRTLDAGSIACVNRIRNPILGARAVMEKSEHLMFVGAGAEAFAAQHGIELVEPSYFSTDERRQQLHTALAKAAGALLDHDGEAASSQAPLDERHKMGTVGAVALDVHGNLAAATSTGGMTNKQAGRIGDCPIIGAGTYANNETVAISCTGHGELFIRLAVAHDIHALMSYKGLSLQEACHHVVMEKLPKVKGDGGLIAIDAKGNVCLPFNSEGMYRGYGYVQQAPVIEIYRD